MLEKLKMEMSNAAKDQGDKDQGGEDQLGVEDDDKEQDQKKEGKSGWWLKPLEFMKEQLDFFKFTTRSRRYSGTKTFDVFYQTHCTSSIAYRRLRDSGVFIMPS
eukprot:Nk52_evm1s1239 gene=Nk52_evmTU1s1239